MVTNEQIIEKYNEIKTKVYKGALIRHINKCFNLKLKSQDLYDIVNHVIERPKCKNCGKDLKYIDWTHGYQTYCSIKCFNQDPETIEKIKNSKIKNGTIDNWQNGHKKFLKDNNIKNCSQLKEVKLQKYKTKLKNFGDGNYNNRKLFHETMKEKYGVENALQNYSINEKRKQTNLKRYGVTEYGKTEEFILKSQQTKLLRYGDPYYRNHEKALKTIAFNHNVLGKTTLHAEKQWLREINIPKNNKQIYFNKSWYVPDGLDEENKIIYEFLGDFWHGNPNTYNPQDINPRTKTTFKQLHEQTFERFDNLKRLGYKIIYIWYTDYKKFGISKNQEY